MNSQNINISYLSLSMCFTIRECSIYSERMKVAMGTTRLSQCLLAMLVSSLLLQGEKAAQSLHDYRDANLSKSIMFFEGLRCGKLPTNQHMNWRKD